MGNIQNISINTHKKYIGGSQTTHSNSKRWIQDTIRTKLTSLDVSDVDIYRICGEKHTYDAGSERRLCIFLYGTQNNDNEDVKLETYEKINGLENAFVHFLAPAGGESSVLIKSEEGRILAEYFRNKWELNILFDLFSEFNNVHKKIFEFIMSEFERLVWYPKTLENSWKFSQNKAALTNRFTSALRRTKEDAIRTDERSLRDMKSSIEDYKRKIKSYSESIAQKMRYIETEKTNLNNVEGSLIKDLDLIIQNEKIKDLHIKDNIFIIHTNPLYIYADNGKKYYGGEYRVELNPENTDVRFFGGTPRRSYWTERDPHPHVNGSDGHACLGNVSSTIAELCAQMQIYALVMICVDFLESANTEDAAGRKVVNWDEVKEDGTIIPANEARKVVCHHCGNRVEPESLSWVYEDYDDDGDPCNSHQVCQSCANRDYTYDEEYSEYVRITAYDERYNSDEDEEDEE